jgi:uncharacterized SAM-binding protein YcdF (DUF218 family)
MLPPTVDWNACPPAPMAWIPFRELLLAVASTPALLLPLLALLGLLLMGLAGLAWPWRALLSGLLVALASLLYSTLATTALTAWLSSQLPAPPPPAPGPALAVLVGRGDDIAHATTTLAAGLLAEGRVDRLYISGDTPTTAQRLLDLGVPPQRIAGDSCARTTWENATLTTAWIRQHLPASTPVLLITDPWQLPRASRAFARHNLPVTPIAAEPPITPHERNRLALRESAATWLYRLQGRM